MITKNSANSIIINAPYQAMAEIYDNVVALPVFPLLCGAFIDTTRRHHIHYKTIADLGCGTGTFSRYLARQGYTVIGVDKSDEMLEIANQKATSLLPSKANHLLHYTQQDMRYLKLEQPVDLLTCQFNTINYFIKPKELSSVLKCCWAALKTPGYLLFDFITGEGVSMIKENKKINHGKTVSYWRTTTIPDKKLSRVQITIKHKANNHPMQSETHIQRWYSLESMSTLLARNGFEVIDTFDMEALKEADKNSYWVQILAKKV